MDALTHIRQLEQERIRLSQQPYVSLTPRDHERLTVIRQKILALWPTARIERAAKAWAKDTHYGSMESR